MEQAAALRIPTVTPGARLVVILDARAALGPLSFDMYLSAFPKLRETVGASASAVRRTLTCALLGLGLLLVASLQLLESVPAPYRSPGGVRVGLRGFAALARPPGGGR